MSQTLLLQKFREVRDLASKKGEETSIAFIVEMDSCLENFREAYNIN